MKTYPSITYNINKSIPVYAFDKLDGSNIRAEWTTKKGFWKFGTRKRLLDSTDLQLGKAPGLIVKKYQEDISEIFKKNKIGKAICFFEYYGENSFAGNHEENEEHTVTLIDVNPYKKGILPPKDFIKLFGHLDIPKVLFNGKVNDTFIEQVRSKNLEDMTFEGVVCKGIHKNQLTMFKIKSREWIAKVKNYFNHNEKQLKELLDPSELMLENDSYRQRRFCPKCFRSGSLAPICICGGSTYNMHFQAQPPRKGASKMRWKDFFREWYPQLNFSFYWKNRF